MATESIIRITQVANLDSRLTVANTQANTARDSANTAYNQANAAYNQANNAYLAANNSNLKSGGTITGDLQVTGNLYIGTGNATYVNVSSIAVNDSIIQLSTNSVSDTLDIGFVGHYNNGSADLHSGIVRRAVDKKFYLFDGYNVEPTNNIIDISNTKTATLVANLQANSITLVGNAVATAANTSAAYNQANVAYDKANTAYDQANSAFGQANAVYGASNIVYAQANAAYAQANAAYNAANNNIVDVFSNSGLILANSANLTFNNTATVNAVVAANGTYGSNIAFAVNTSAIGGGSLSNIAVSANSGSTINANGFNFVNSATVTVSVTAGINGNANISFTSAGGGGGSGNANVTVSDTAPSGPRANQDFWWNSNTGTLKIYYNDGDSSQWVDAVTPKIGPQGPQGPSANVTVRANSASTQNNVALNFVNTATISVSVTAGSSGNANIAFSTAGASESFHPFLLGI